MIVLSNDGRGIHPTKPDTGPLMLKLLTKIQACLGGSESEIRFSKFHFVLHFQYLFSWYKPNHHTGFRETTWKIRTPFLFLCTLHGIPCTVI